MDKHIFSRWQTALCTLFVLADGLYLSGIGWLSLLCGAVVSAALLFFLLKLPGKLLNAVCAVLALLLTLRSISRIFFFWQYEGTQAALAVVLLAICVREVMRMGITMLPEMGKILSLPDQDYHVFYRIGSNSRKADRENFSRVYGDSVDNADVVSDIVREEYPHLAQEAFRFAVFQRLEYLLHIPISQMTADNGQYREIVGYLRKNWLRAMKNRILTGKNKLYHTLFAIAPRGIRRLHRKLCLERRQRN